MNKTSSGLPATKIAVIVVAILIGVFGFAKFFPGQQKAKASVDGPTARHTNAPGEGNCTACHTDFPINSGGGSMTITGLPANYLPGQQIPVTVRVSQANQVIYGFQMTAIDARGRRVGTYTLPPDTPPKLQTLTDMVGGQPRLYIEHTQQGVTPLMLGFNSWTFTWTAPATRAGKVSFYAAGNAADSNGGSGGDYIYTTSAATLSGSAISNFDSDTRSDLAVFRPSTGFWYALTSSGTFETTQWGLSGDKMAPADYDADGKTDFAVFRPSNTTWYLRNTSGTLATIPFGLADDVPVPADYDGDLKADIAVFRPSNSTWYILRSSDGQYVERQFGLAGDKIAHADYDADGKTDIAVWRPSNANWYINTSSNNGYSVINFGLDGDRPVQSDYDGDGRADLAVFRPSNSTWYFFNSLGYSVIPFGLAGDLPAPADFDGDGKTDLAVYRNNTWYIFGTAGPTYNVTQFGLAGDIPVPAGYLAN